MQPQNTNKENQQQLPQPSQPYRPHMSKGMKAGLIILGVAIFGFYVLLVVVLGLYTITSTTAAHVYSNQLVEAIQDADAARIYSLGSDEFRSTTTEFQLQGVIYGISSALQGEARVKDTALSKASGGPTTATVVYEVDSPSGTNYLKVTLKEVDGEWQVLNFFFSENPLTAQ